MKYFLAENANRKVLGEIVFEIVDLFAGTVRGVYSTRYDTLAAKLAKEPGVQEITEAQFDEYLKKKSPALSNSLSSKPPTPESQISLAVLPAAVDLENSKKNKPKLATVADALKPEKVPEKPDKAS